jgi:nucleotide-binding universal stress UspA family protein
MANKIQKILVPLDGSQNSMRGLDTAISIARPTGATITVLHVIHIPATAALRLTPQQRKKEITYVESIINKALEKAKNSQVNFKARTETGDPGQKITQVAKNGKYDLVVVGSRGRGTTKEMFLGSVSNHVLHKLHAPVLVVK